MTEEQSRTPVEPDRHLDAEALKALAHPVRMRIFDILAVHGPHTASGLADRLAESTGTTSYHLRQLERWGLVREVEGRGTARERWWERVPGPVSIHPSQVGDAPSARAAAATVLRHWEENRGALLHEFLERADTELPEEWREAGTVATVNLRLNADELRQVTESWHRWSQEHLMPLRGRSAPGSRPVQIHFNAFPVMGGAVTPSDGPPEPQPDPRGA